MRVELVTVAYNSGSDLEGLLQSARSATHRVGIHLFLHSNHAATAAACERAAQDSRVTYRPFRVNRGLSRSWNDGIIEGFEAGAEIVVVANDDIAFGPGDLDRLVGVASRDRSAYIVTCAGPHQVNRRWLPSHGYACFAINRIALELLGCFDENFFPAYCEDQDYARRALLAGLHEENCADSQVIHRGSASIGRDAELAAANAYTHQRNLEYYRRKWGGDAGAETFSNPFADCTVGLRISPEARHAPYGGYNRKDLL